MRMPLNFFEGWLRERGREVVQMFSDLSQYALNGRASKRGKPGRSRVSSGSDYDTSTRSALVKSRPASLEQRYQMISDEHFGDDVFLRLQKRLFSLANQGLCDGRGQRIVYKEHGRISPNRPYFYLKPSGASGLLFERSGPGWVVSRAEKLVDRDLFLREGGILEHANIYLAQDRVPLPRIRSDLLGNDLLAFSVYEQKLLKHLGLNTAADQADFE